VIFVFFVVAFTTKNTTATKSLITSCGNRR
jgi:hypothetical protein